MDNTYTNLTSSLSSKVFKVGNLYKTTASIPMYLFKGVGLGNIQEDGSSIKQIGWTCSLPGIPVNPKITIPGEQVVMCLAIESFPDRRRFDRHTSDNKVLVSKNKILSEDTQVYEVMFLYRERRYIIVCQGSPSLKLIQSLFFSPVPILL